MNSTSTMMRSKVPQVNAQRYLIATRANSDDPSLQTLLGVIVLLVMSMCLALLALSAWTKPATEFGL